MTRPQTETRATIAGLHGHVIPHERWMLHRWFSHTPLWYYHRPQPVPTLNLTNRFYRQIDPDVRPLCKALHSLGVHTGPSCQGHFYSRDHFKRIWEQLRHEADAIRERGITVTDSETSRTFLFRDSAHMLPWSRFERFYDEIARHQSIGYMGVVLNAPLRRSRGTRVRARNGDHRFSIETDDAVTDRLRAPMLHVRVNAADPHERHQMWREASEALGAMLGVTIV